MTDSSLPIPEFFDANKVGAVWRFPFEERAKAAQNWANRHGLQPASSDLTKTWLLLIDVQNTFCIPDFELYVGGRSGRGAVIESRLDLEVERVDPNALRFARRKATWGQAAPPKNGSFREREATGAAA